MHPDSFFYVLWLMEVGGCMLVCVCVCVRVRVFGESETLWSMLRHCFWRIHICDTIKLYVSFANEPYERDYILQKRPKIWRTFMYVTGGMTHLSVRHDSFMWRTGISIYVDSLFIYIHTYIYSISVCRRYTNFVRGRVLRSVTLISSTWACYRVFRLLMFWQWCVSVWLCVCVSVRVRVNMCMCARESVSACVVCMCVTCACYRAFPLLSSGLRCVSVWLHVRVCVVYVSVRVRVDILTIVCEDLIACVYVSARVCVSAWMYVRVCVCVCV